jgi:hypothetical protein
MNKHPDCFKLVIKNVPISCQDDLTCFLIIESLQIIATGANDMVIRLYENKNDLSKNHKKLKGHVKGIKVSSSLLSSGTCLLKSSKIPHQLLLRFWRLSLEHLLGSSSCKACWPWGSAHHHLDCSGAETSLIFFATFLWRQRSVAGVGSEDILNHLSYNTIRLSRLAG